MARKKSSKADKEADVEPDSDKTVLEMENLNEPEKQIVTAQIENPPAPPVSFLQLFRYTTPFERFLNIAGLVAAIGAGVMQPLQTVVFGNLTNVFVNFGSALLASAEGAPGSDQLLQQAKREMFAKIDAQVLRLVYIGLGMFGFSFIYYGSWTYTGEAAARRIREKYLRAVLRQNVGWMDKVGAGEVTTRIQNDTNLIQMGISTKIPLTAMYLAQFVAGFTVAFIRNWRLALIVSSIVPAMTILGGVIATVAAKYTKQMLAETAQGGKIVEEVISSIRTARAFGSEKRFSAMYQVRNLNTQELGIKLAKLTCISMGLFMFVIYGAYGLSFWEGTRLIAQGRADSGEVVSVFLAVMIGTFSMAFIAPNFQAIASAQGAATELFATITRVPVIDSSSADGIILAATDGKSGGRRNMTISFENVSFVYPSRPSVKVLQDFDATFPSGKVTALVGASGSGKSTIVWLLERFYDPIQGGIRIDGIHLKDLNVRSLRSNIGLVSQEPVLFSASIAENVERGLIGSPYEHEVGDERRARIVEACKKSNAHSFITLLPRGYDTLIGERGILLSGGQKQRIAIARAIVSDPAILLLDEATSALDTASETLVQDALDKASQGRTTICIAHRLSTIIHSTQIIVMAHGQIQESATSTVETSAHSLLLRNPTGPYSRLVSAQSFREQELLPSTAVALEKLEDPLIFSSDLKEEDDLISTTLDIEKGVKAKRLPNVNLGDFFGPFIRLFRMNSTSKWDYVLGGFGGCLNGMVYPVFGIIFGEAIGVFSETGSDLHKGGDRYSLYCLVIALVAGLGGYCVNRGFCMSTERLASTLRSKTFHAILSQEIAFFDQETNSTGHLTASVTDFAQRIHALYGPVMGVIVQSCVTLIGGAIIGLSFAWKVSLVGISCVPLTLLAGFAELQRFFSNDNKSKAAHQDSSQVACEAAAAIRTVAALTLEDDCCKRYSKCLDRPQKLSNQSALFANGFYSISQSLAFWVIGLVFWFGFRQLINGEVSTRNFFIGLESVVIASMQAGAVFAFVPDISKAYHAAKDSFLLLDSDPVTKPKGLEGDILKECQGDIVFKDVHFSYPTRPNIPVLKGISLHVKPGATIAVVGPSGGGKSTICHLIERFYNPTSGTILLDGVDVSTLRMNSYRENIAVVSQEPTLYTGTLRFNIVLGTTTDETTVTQEAIERACRDANIHDFIVSLPDGYDTEVGAKGVELSGGQKQRIAIARALIRNPKVLLLDEATSALDSQSETVVQAALDQASKGRPTIAIAHRLTTVMGCDLILVLQDGVIAEQGTHFELLEKKGIYYELVVQQDLSG